MVQGHRIGSPLLTPALSSPEGRRGRIRRSAALPCVLVLVVCAALAACGDLPRPFQPAEKSLRAWSAPGDIAWGSILVPPVAGLPAARSAALVDAVVGALQVREVPASARTGGRGSIVLAGRVSAVTGKLRWTLVTPDGEAALRFEEPLLDVARIDETAPDLTVIAERAARRIAEALEPPVADDGIARLAAPVVLEGVRGAPGEGGIALARAMRDSLARIGVAVADAPDGEARLISGRVSVVRDEPATDDAAVTIAWDVLRPDGTRLGTVSQSNRVSLERLTGAWGALAPMVARAGAPGIAQLLAQTEEPRFAEAPQRRAPVEPPLRLATDASPGPSEAPIQAAHAPAIDAAHAPAIDPPLAVAVEARTASLSAAIEVHGTPPEQPAEAPPTPPFKPLPVPTFEPRPGAPIAVSIVVSAALQ